MKNRVKWGAGALVIAGALLLAACGSGAPGMGDSPTTSASSSGGSTITISNFMFMPMSISVSPGATVKVTNKDTATHTLTAIGGQFTTGNITHDQTKIFTAPSKPGTYHYICSIHQFMMGTIVVK
jgi:plastocyanin